MKVDGGNSGSDSGSVKPLSCCCPSGLYGILFNGSCCTALFAAGSNPKLRRVGDVGIFEFRDCGFSRFLGVDPVR